MSVLRLITVVLSATMLMAGPVHADETITDSGIYAGFDLLWPESCDEPTLSTGVVCFDVNRALTSASIEARDLSGEPIRMWIEFSVEGQGVGSSARVCGSGALEPPHGVIEWVIVHVELYADDECNGSQFTPVTAGEILFSYS